MTLTPETLSATAGALLALAAAYLPGFAGWFDVLETVRKRLLMLALLALAAAGSLALSCAGWAAALGLDGGPTCDTPGALAALRLFLAALVANQAAYQIGVRRRTDDREALAVLDRLFTLDDAPTWRRRP